MIALQDRVADLLERANRQVLGGLRRKLRVLPPSWSGVENNLPWLDQPNALEALDHQRNQGALNEGDYQLLRKWVHDGYVVIDGLVGLNDIDAMVDTLDRIWEADTPIDKLMILGIKEDEQSHARNISHADLLRFDVEKRLHIRSISDWRIHGFYRLNPYAMKMYGNEAIRNVVSKIFGKPAKGIAAINFMYGSQQALHQDMAVFHIYPHNYLVGAWIACEDISESAGPLVFFPGSHRNRLYTGFEQYPQTNLRTADKELARRYQEYVDTLALDYQRKHFLGRKGQVLLWHGMLIHGGEPIQTPGLSRKSMVLHYSVPGANKHFEIRGPVNW